MKFAVQAVALGEWNSNSARPEWGLHILRRYSPEPLSVDRLLYLSPPQREALRGWADKDRRYVDLEREAIVLMRELHTWVKRARSILSKRHGDDGVIGSGVIALERLLDPITTVEEISARFEGAAGELAYSNRARSNLVRDIPRLLGRKATTRELALASLLFGLFPKADDDVAWMGVLGRTVSQAIDAE